MPKVDTKPATRNGTLIDDLEVPRYILEMIFQLQRLAARFGDTELERDLATVRSRADDRRKRRLN